MASDQAKVEKFLEKHKPRSIEEDIVRQESAKAKYATDLSRVMDNLTEFLDITDPLVFNEKAIAWVRRPTMKEVKTLFPKEMLENLDQLDTLDEETLESYDRRVFEVMELLIKKPKLTAEEWTEKSNPLLIRLFYEHLGNIVKLIQPEISGF